MLTFYGAGKKAAHAAKTVKHGVSTSFLPVWLNMCKNIFTAESEVMIVVIPLHNLLDS